jgi:hypothetical protein
MLDFLSSRPSTDEQTRRCAGLLATIIADSIRTLGVKPRKEEFKRRGSDGDAQESLNFLFRKDSPFPVYAQLIGLDAQAIREKVLQISEHDKNLVPDWGPMQRKAARLRIHWYMAAKRGQMAPDEAFETF